MKVQSKVQSIFSACVWAKVGECTLSPVTDVDPVAAGHKSPVAVDIHTFNGLNSLYGQSRDHLPSSYHSTLYSLKTLVQPTPPKQCVVYIYTKTEATPRGPNNLTCVSATILKATSSRKNHGEDRRNPTEKNARLTTVPNRVKTTTTSTIPPSRAFACVQYRT